MLLTLWLYAVSRGVSSAREVERLSESETGFRWVVGDQRVSHATLSGFRVGNRAALERLMTDIIAVLLQKGLLALDFVAQDGARVRASAAAPSFRREATLLECRGQAELHVKAVLAEADDPDASATEKAARLAAARDYERSVNEAIATVKTLQKPDGTAPRAFGAIGWPCFESVVRRKRRLRRAWRPFCRMIRSTRLRATRTPRARRFAWTRGLPYVQRLRS